MKILRTLGLLTFMTFILSGSLLAQDKKITVGLLGSSKTATITDIKDGNIEFVFYEDGKVIDAELICCKIIHLPKRGEMNAPYQYCKDGSGETIQSRLQELILKEGDRLFIEDIVFNLDGRKQKMADGIALSF